MRSGWCASLALIGLGLPLPAQDAAPESPYCPLKVGTRWEYRSGDRNYTVTVRKQQKAGSVDAMLVETESERGSLAELLAVGADGLYRHASNGDAVEPPLRLLKLPARPGESWKVQVKCRGQLTRGTFTLTEADVQVPAGKFRAIVAEGNLQIDDHRFTLVSWYAPGIGLVRQAIRIDGREEVLELVKFTPGK
jgi:hypothetical protein